MDRNNNQNTPSESSELNLDQMMQVAGGFGESKLDESEKYLYNDLRSEYANSDEEDKPGVKAVLENFIECMEEKYGK